MKFFLPVLLTLPVILFSQKRKRPDVVSNVETRAIMMKGFGNNTFSKDVGVFAGFGFGGNLMTPIKFGVGADYNLLFGNVKYGHEDVYGPISGPKINNIDFFITHRDEINENFSVEELLGYSFIDIKNTSRTNRSQTYRQNGGGVHVGAKIVYAIDRRGYQNFVLTAKAIPFFSDLSHDASRDSSYYEKSVFINLSLGYRYNF